MTWKTKTIFSLFLLLRYSMINQSTNSRYSVRNSHVQSPRRAVSTVIVTEYQTQDAVSRNIDSTCFLVYIDRSIDWLNLIRPASAALRHILLCYRITSNLHTVFEYNDNRGVCLVMSYDLFSHFMMSSLPSSSSDADCVTEFSYTYTSLPHSHYTQL